MSTVGSALLACEDIQGELDSYFQTCGHASLRDESPYLQFVFSPENRTGINQVINPGGAKTRTLILRYDQLIPTSEVTEVNECTLDCTATTERGDLSATYELDICQKIKVEEVINIYTLAAICRSNPDYIMSRINIMAGAIEAKLAEKTAEEAVDLVGNWASNVANVTGNVLNVATRLTGGINLNPNFMSKISLAQRMTGYCRDSAIFGSSELWESADNMNAGCCAANGIDLFRMLDRYGKVIMWDKYITDAFGGDLNALSTQFGAMQLLYFTLGSEASFSPIVGAAAQNFEVIPMLTPRYGIPVDLMVSNNCGNLSMIMTLASKLVAPPFDLFPVGDTREGVNFVNNIQVVNP